MDDSGFIVPPPGLIPPRPSDAPGTGRSASPGRPLPAFTPPPGLPAAPGAGPAAPAQQPRPVWRLVLAGGHAVPVGRTLLLGRNPSHAALPGAPDAELVAIDDPTSTVSKTHAALAPDGDDLTVTDLHSTNGVVVDGARAEPGEPVRLRGSADLLLGDLRVRVELS
ncbi:FHA domain-containing protein [Leifsonia sp. 22587]|uniref:FHA domain-containing protein n=1 Tax=Leifsonia sp. 22587 TaxID=3453946 RepID=UPI003F841F92